MVLHGGGEWRRGWARGVHAAVFGLTLTDLSPQTYRHPDAGSIARAFDVRDRADPMRATWRRVIEMTAMRRGPRPCMRTAPHAADTRSDADESNALRRRTRPDPRGRPSCACLLLRGRANAGAAGGRGADGAAAVWLRGDKALGRERMPAVRSAQHATQSVQPSIHL